MDWIVWVVLGALLIVMFVLPMFTRKKQQTQVNTMLSNISPGDKIKTVGGIIGTVIRVEQTSPVDKEFVIETGEVNKTEIRLDINAIYQVLFKANAPAPEITPFEEAAPKAVEEDTAATTEEDTSATTEEAPEAEVPASEAVSEEKAEEVKKAPTKRTASAATTKKANTSPKANAAGKIDDADKKD